jgi:superfamily II DNA/RNA helicase
MLFSATLDSSIDAVVRRYLNDPVVCSVEPTPATAVEAVHHVLAVSAVDKAAVVREVARHARRAVLFTRTKRGAHKLAGQLRLAGIDALELHGNLSQPNRQRNLGAFADGSATVLVATDIAARGIHVDNIDLVVHVDPPVEHKADVHRSGRTARAGATGVVATLMTPDQASDVHRMTKAAGITATMTKVTATHPLLASLSKATPRSETAQLAQPRPSGRPTGRPRRRDRRPAARVA